MNTPKHGYWIQTHTGKAFDLLEPTPGMVDIEDIAYALARLCRFTGHCARHYSVAEHSVNVAKQCQLEHGFSDQWALAALLHDATEAYIGDLSSPLKAIMRTMMNDDDHPECTAPRVMSDLDIIEHGIKCAITVRFGLDHRPVYLDHEEVAYRKRLIKGVDLRMLATERRDLMPAHPEWDSTSWFKATGHAPPEPYEWTISSHTQGRDYFSESASQFKALFYYLGGRR